MPSHYIILKKDKSRKESKKRNEDRKNKAEVNEAMKKKKISKVDYKNLRRINI
jgi:hypothetical protein